MNRVRTASIVAGIASAVALIQTLRLRRSITFSTEPSLDDAQEWLLNIKTTSERLFELEQHIEEVQRKPPREQPENQGKARGLPLAISVVLSLLSYTFYPHHTLLAGSTALAALASCSLAARGPWRCNGSVTTVVARLLFLLQFIAIAYYAVHGIAYYTANPILNSEKPLSLLGLTIFGITGSAISIFLLMTWLPEWRYTASLAVGLMAVLLGVLCLPVVQKFTQGLTFPDVHGAGQLYVARDAASPNIVRDAVPPKVKFSVEICHNPIGNICDEHFIVANNSSDRIKLALLLVGDAMVRPGFDPGGCPETNSTVAQSVPSGSQGEISAPNIAGSAPVQLFSCTLKSGSKKIIKGDPYRTFVNFNFIHKAFSLPTYGQGIFTSKGDLGAVASLIETDLGPSWADSDPNLTVSVDGLNLVPLETVTQSSPASASTDDAQWTGNSNLSIEYATTSQDAAETTTNVLFIFAVLLGASAAGIFASMQGVIEVISNRKPDK